VSHAALEDAAVEGGTHRARCIRSVDDNRKTSLHTIYSEPGIDMGALQSLSCGVDTQEGVWVWDLCVRV